MRKKFKKRLLGIILTILMVVSVIPVQQVQPVKAADTQIIYLEISGGVTGWTTPGVHALDAKDTIVNNLFAMDKVAGSDNIYKANIAANATKVIFTPNNTWKNGETDTVSIADANADLTTTYPCYKVTSYQSGSKKCWKGTWATYSASGEVDLTERFYVSTNLVDYINDARFDPGNKTRGYSNNNQGTVVDGSEKGANVYSYLDAAISGSPWYNSSGQDSKECQYTYPLYFGNMFDTKNRYGRMLNGSWYGLNNFSVGANVALEETGTTTGSSFYGAAAQGLVGKKLVNGKMVDPNNENVVLPYFSGEEIHPYNTDREIDKNKNLSEYYNNLQFPFKQTMDKNGVITYSYDSGSDYAVYYDFDNNSFYESNQYIQNGTTNDSTAPTKGFYPLNKPGDSREAVNMGFGTEFTIPFTLSKDGKINGQDITFNFTGDDDVWVFIDDYLVLDMGGAHRMASGTIDFAKKNVTVERAFTPDKSTTAAWKDGATRANQTSTESLKTFADIETDNGKTFADIMADDSKVHTLKMFYMERGMIDSNMSVSFNFSPIPSGLTLSKDVNTASVNDGLKSVVETKDNFDFTVTDTDTRTEYTYEKDYDGTRTEKKTTTNGVVEGLADNVYAKNFAYKDADDDGNTGLKIGTDFTITETENSNYDTRWFVTDISTGETKDRGDGLVSNFKLGDATSDVTKVNYNVNFVNTPKVGTVNITKAWNGTVPETLKEEAFPFKVEVDLDGAAKKDEYSTYALKYTVDGNEFYTDADGNFKLKCDQTAAFEGIPTGATVKVTETTTTDSKSWEVSGSDEAVSKPVTETSNETLTITNATKTKTSDKVIYVEAGKDTFYKPANVETGYTVSKMSDGLTYTDKGFNGAEPGKSYTANYTGSNKDGAIVNGKITVYTYQATDKVYVFDYGLESNIAETNDNHDGLFEGGTFYNDNAKDAYETTAKLNQITHEKDNNPQTTITPDQDVIINKKGSAKGAVTFKPIAFMDKAENYTYTADITKNGETLKSNNPETGTTVHGKIKTMPANVVYYEDDFNADSKTDDGTTKIVYSGDTDPEGTSLTLKQSNGQTEQYGHDDAYAKGTGDSAGSSTKMTANGYNTRASFTFKGTGFDIVARTTTDTATIMYSIEHQTAGKWQVDKMGAVDTYYANGDLYQIPVIHEEGLDYNTYTVTLFIKEDVNKNCVVYLDGVRVYNPMGTAGNSAYIDNEEGATITKISDLVLGDGEITENGVVIRDPENPENDSTEIKGVTISNAKMALVGNVWNDAGTSFDNLEALGYTKVEDNSGTTTANNTQSILQYLHTGPNNEVYLDGNASIAFVAEGTPNSNSTLQIEAKLVNTEGIDVTTEGTAALNVWNGTALEKIEDVKTSTARYYTINLNQCIKLGDTDKYLVVISGNDSDGNYGVSFSNLKNKGYTLSNPLAEENKELVGRLINTDNVEPASVFKSFGIQNATYTIKRNAWLTNKYTVTINSADVFAGETPKFKVYYTNNGKKTALTTTIVKTTNNEDGTVTYGLKFRAPNAVGSFPLEIHYVNADGESDEFMTTTIKVRR